jgi:hypothetical protein
MIYGPPLISFPVRRPQTCSTVWIGPCGSPCCAARASCPTLLGELRSLVLIRPSGPNAVRWGRLPACPVGQASSLFYSGNGCARGSAATLCGGSESSCAVGSSALSGTALGWAGMATGGMGAPGGAAKGTRVFAWQVGQCTLLPANPSFTFTRCPFGQYTTIPMGRSACRTCRFGWAVLRFSHHATPRQAPARGRRRRASRPR